MANTKSSKKSIRKTAKLTARNKSVKSRIKNLFKKLSSSSGADAKAVAIECVSSLDKASKSNVIHANKVSRIKSRLSKVIFSCDSTQCCAAADTNAAE